MLIVAILTYAMNLFDLFRTLKLAEHYGDDIEANPVGRLLLKKRAVAVVYKCVVVGALIAVLYIALAEYVMGKVCLWIAFSAYAALTVYHVALYTFAKPR